MCRAPLLARFIPAGAGNLIATSSGQTSAPVYPRSRGELVQAVLLMAIYIGLSPLLRGTFQFALINFITFRFIPLVRGTLLRDDIREGTIRFIPAHAGNTSFAKKCGLSDTVYPRSRGELNMTSGNAATYDGLSPLARGTYRRASKRLNILRSIPARAGNLLKISD